MNRYLNEIFTVISNLTGTGAVSCMGDAVVFV